MNRRAIYTAIFGSYDALKPLPFPNEGYDHICFTDNENIFNPNGGWTIIPVILDPDLSPRKNARKYKILGHEYLQQYYLSIWLDATVSQRVPIDLFMAQCMENMPDMAVISHPNHTCLYEEAQVCKTTGRGLPAQIIKMEERYLEMKVPHNLSVIASGILVRKYNAAVIEMMEYWWQEVYDYSERDQISFSYIAWKFPHIKLNYLDFQETYKQYFHLAHHQGNYHSGNKK